MRGKLTYYVIRIPDSVMRKTWKMTPPHSLTQFPKYFGADPKHHMTILRLVIYFPLIPRHERLIFRCKETTRS